MITQDPSVIAQYAGGTALSLLTVAFILQKLLTGWKADKTEASILGMMHNELERMSEQNTKLSLELGKLQTEVLLLNKELRTLTVENQRLHGEVVALTGEVSRLQQVLREGNYNAS